MALSVIINAGFKRVVESVNRKHAIPLSKTVIESFAFSLDGNTILLTHVTQNHSLGHFYIVPDMYFLPSPLKPCRFLFSLQND